jgi:cell division protein FtsQ
MARRIQSGSGTLPGLEEGAQGTVIDVEAAPARKPAARRRIRLSTARLVLGATAAAVVFGLSLGAFYLFERLLIRDPRFALQGAGTWDTPTLQILGATHASPRAIEAVFAGDLGRSIYLVPVSARLTTLRSVDWVREASIARVWPNRMLVQVKERTPVAFVTLPSSRVGLIDADGVILPTAPSRFDLPVLAGVKAGAPVAERRDAVQRMLLLLAELGDAAKDISEIDVSDRDNLAVSQPYKGRSVKLLLGDRNFAVRYGNFVNHYDDIQSRLPGAGVLDLRLEDRITVVE